MCNKSRVKKSKIKVVRKNSRCSSKSTANLRILTVVLVLFGTFVLAGIALTLRIETPFVWAFLSGIGNWLVLTSLLKSLR